MTHTAAGLRLLAMKTTPIEKFQYLVHLKATNVHLFYRLLSENIKVREKHSKNMFAPIDILRN